MTLNAQALEYMAKRDELSSFDTNLIDVVFEVLYSYDKSLAKDDTAAELESALIRFILDSRE